MSCVCGSNRIFSIDAKCDDRCDVSFKNAESNSYVPCGLGIGGGNYLRFSVCAECARIQGFTPLTQNQIIGAIRGEEIDHDARIIDWDDYPT